MGIHRGVFSLMNQGESDPYARNKSAVRPAPSHFLGRLRHLGPSVVISGSIIGSGELVLTSSLGAAAGFTLLWWVLVACWSKSLVQAELARYTVVSGDTYLRALNRVPWRWRIKGAPVSWTLWLSLLSFVPGTVGMGGILGGGGQALAILVPGLGSSAATVILALVTAAILYSGSYLRLERIMLVLVAGFTLATLASLVAMQYTPYRITLADLAGGLEFQFSAGYLVLALAVYGATGVNSAELSTYPYWCIEKGYAAFIGDGGTEPERLQRARGWLRVLQLDVWVTLAVLTCATLPFYLLGAGVLHAGGKIPQGLEMVHVLSGMFTQTLGNWSLWLFGGAAFFILWSSVLSGYGGTARLLPDFLVEFGLLHRERLSARKAWIRGWGTAAPLAGCVFYLTARDPLVLLLIGAVAGAVLLPIQSGSTLWLQRNHLEAPLRASTGARLALWLTFLFQAAMVVLVVRYALPWG